MLTILSNQFIVRTTYTQMLMNPWVLEEISNIHVHNYKIITVCTYYAMTVPFLKIIGFLYCQSTTN